MSSHSINGSMGLQEEDVVGLERLSRTLEQHLGHAKHLQAQLIESNARKRRIQAELLLLSTHASSIKTELKLLKSEVLASGSQLLQDVGNEIWRALKTRFAETANEAKPSPVLLSSNQVQGLLKDLKRVKTELKLLKSDAVDLLAEFATHIKKQNVSILGLPLFKGSQGMQTKNLQLDVDLPSQPKVRIGFDREIREELRSCHAMLFENLGTSLVQAVTSMQKNTFLSNKVLEHISAEGLKRSLDLQAEVWTLQAENHYLQDCLQKARKRASSAIGPKHSHARSHKALKSSPDFLSSD